MTTVPQYTDAHFRRIVEYSRDAILVIAADGTILYASNACEEVFGHKPEWLVGRNGVDLLHPDDVAVAIERLAGSFDHSIAMQPPMRTRFAMPDGAWRWVETRTQWALPDDELGGVVLNVRDMHEEVLAEQELRETKERLAHLASHDSLTGLANRARCIEHLDALCADLGAHDHPPFVLFVDVDHFKAVNDTYGHAGGDAVLVAIAARLRRAVRGSDLVARLGGDEFVVVCEGSSSDTTHRVLDRVTRLIADPIPFGATRIQVTVSTGLSRVEPGVAASAVLSAADVAMYQAKSRGRNQWADTAAPGA